MSDRTAIEWTDASWNPIRAMVPTPDGPKYGWHCEHKSEGCRNCYAEAFNRRLGTGFGYKPGHLLQPLRPGQIHRRGDVSIVLDEKMLLLPLKWRKPRKIFVCSMTDLFADFVTDEMIDQVFAVMALCPEHVFQVLTKRPERMRAYLAGDQLDLRIDAEMTAIIDHEADPLNRRSDDLRATAPCLDECWPLQNVWLGCSVEDQAAAAERIPLLLDSPAAVRWLSCEPLLGPVQLGALPYPREWPRCDCLDAGPRYDVLDRSVYCDGCCEGPERIDAAGIDWVVVGGESGREARPMHQDWARSLRDQCADTGVPFLFKQWGKYRPCTEAELKSACGATLVGDRVDGAYMLPVGKKSAGRLLDGVQHDGYPA